MTYTSNLHHPRLPTSTLENPLDSGSTIRLREETKHRGTSIRNVQTSTSGIGDSIFQELKTNELNSRDNLEQKRVKKRGLEFAKLCTRDMKLNEKWRCGFQDPEYAFPLENVSLPGAFVQTEFIHLNQDGQLKCLGEIWLSADGEKLMQLFNENRHTLIEIARILGKTYASCFHLIHNFIFPQDVKTKFSLWSPEKVEYFKHQIRFAAAVGINWDSLAIIMQQRFGLVYTGEECRSIGTQMINC
jgi:hypothetical protein